MRWKADFKSNTMHSLQLETDTWVVRKSGFKSLYLLSRTLDGRVLCYAELEVESRTEINLFDITYGNYGKS